MNSQVLTAVQYSKLETVVLGCRKHCGETGLNGGKSTLLLGIGGLLLKGKKKTKHEMQTWQSLLEVGNTSCRHLMEASFVIILLLLQRPYREEL